MCELCRQTFMVNARPPLLWQHVQAKHLGTDPLVCFPVHMQGFDPSDPKGEKKPVATAAAPVKPKKEKKDDGLDALLSAGLVGNKKKAAK
jgi:Zinc-binding